MTGGHSRASLIVDDGLVIAAENNMLRQQNSELQQRVTDLEAECQVRELESQALR